MQPLFAGMSALLLLGLLPWPGSDSGSIPQIHIDPGDIGKIKLTCTSEDWDSEPEVHWRDLQRQRLVPASETKTTLRNGLYHVQSSVTVDTSLKDMSCVIRDPLFSEETEAQISVSDALFPRLWPWIVGFMVPLCLLSVGITFGVLFVITRGQLVEAQRRKALGEEGLKILRTYAEDLSLDEDTAHPRLKLSRDRKHVRPAVARQDVPNNPERFDILKAVLGEKGFSAGDHYWEVDVRGKNRWELGLCLDSVTRKGDILIFPGNGFWVLSLENKEYKALYEEPLILNVTESPGVVGIFLQYEKGLISFYNLTDHSFLYTFKSTFNQPLRPYFNPGPHGLGNNADLYLRRCS